MHKRHVATFLVLGMLCGCGTNARDEGKPTPRPDLRIKSQQYLKQIGIAYQTALIQRPPKSADELKEHLEGGDKLLVSPRDNQPFEITWGADPTKQGGNTNATLLAWEKTADDEGGRSVLMADCSTVTYLKEDEFKKAPRAKGSN